MRSTSRIADPARFIRDNTRLQPVSHTPEIALWLADEVTPIWRLTEEELGEMGLPPPFWAFAWAGGQALARWLLDHPEAVKGRRVLDLATGSGLVAIAAMKAGAASVLAADIDPFCAAAVAANALANGVEVAFTADNLLDAAPPPFDLICAGDVFYEGPMAEAVLAWLKAARAQGAEVLVGDPGRTYFPPSGLTLLAQYSVPTTRELEDQEVKRTRVWSLEASAASCRHPRVKPEDDGGAKGSGAEGRPPQASRGRTVNTRAMNWWKASI